VHAARADAAEAAAEEASADAAELRFTLRFAELQRAFASSHAAVRRGGPSPRTPSRTLRRMASPAPTP
jgi:hypothetical protein